MSQEISKLDSRSLWMTPWDQGESERTGSVFRRSVIGMFFGQLSMMIGTIVLLEKAGVPFDFEIDESSLFDDPAFNIGLIVIGSIIYFSSTRIHPK